MNFLSYSSLGHNLTRLAAYLFIPYVIFIGWALYAKIIKKRKKIFGLLITDVFKYSTNSILALAAIAALFVSAAANLAEYRPYIGIEAIPVEKNNDILKAKARIINSGSVPANNIKIIAKQFVDEEVVISYDGMDEPYSSLLLPIPVYLTYPFSIDNNLIGEDNDWTVELTFKYDGVNSKGHETKFLGRYNRNDNTFHILDGYAY